MGRAGDINGMTCFKLAVAASVLAATALTATVSAPAAQACLATSARQVSTLMSWSGKVLRNHSMKGTTRAISSAVSTTSPGPAFTPPTSTTSAPSEMTRWAASLAAPSVKVAPRS